MKFGVALGGLVAGAIAVWAGGTALLAESRAEWRYRALPMDPAWSGAAALDVHPSGMVVGSATFGDDCVAVAWKGDGWTLLEPPSGEPTDQSEAQGISENGLVAGATIRTVPGVQWRATLWNARTGAGRDLHPGTLTVDGVTLDNSWLTQVNNRGEAVGDMFRMDEYANRGRLWSPDGTRDRFLPLLPGTQQSLAPGIDDRGNAAGTCWGTAHGMHATFWPASGGAVDLHAALVAAHPTGGFEESRATDIAADGTVFGTAFAYAGPSPPPVPVLWHADGRVEILDGGGVESAWSGFVTGNWATGQIVWSGETQVEPIVGLWNRGVLVHQGLPGGCVAAQVQGVDARGTAAVTAYTAEWGQVPYVLEPVPATGRAGR